MPLNATDTPRGHAFLELGERLRKRGQLDAAATVALAGLAHYPALADAHDLLGRIRADQDDASGATAAWNAALECDPTHAGARKGLAYIAFRVRDYTAAERHLETASRDNPFDGSVVAALDRVRMSRPPVHDEPLRIDDPSSGVLLYDDEGMRLLGGLAPELGEAHADAVAAEAAGLTREAARAARLLGLGGWRQVVIEGNDARTAVFPVDAGISLVVSRSTATPVGRLVAIGARAVQASREWIGRMS